MTIAAEVGSSRKIVQLIPPIISRRANFASCVAMLSLSSLRSTVFTVWAMRPNGSRKIVRPRFSAPIAPSASIDAIVTSTTSPAFEIVVSARMFGVTRPTRLSPGFGRSRPRAKPEAVAAADLRAEERRELDEDLAEAAERARRTRAPAIPNVG